jgi:hypothetical protein
MFRLLSRHLPALVILLAVFAGFSSLNAAQDQPRRGRKYTPPPETSHITVTVVKETNGKPIESAAVIFHPMLGDKDKGNMELKTNEEGMAVIDVIPTNSTVRLQVIATGFQTFGNDYKIDGPTKEIVVKLKRPVRQYSTYEHANDPQPGASDHKDTDQKAKDAPADKPKS